MWNRGAGLLAVSVAVVLLLSATYSSAQDVPYDFYVDHTVIRPLEHDRKWYQELMELEWIGANAEFRKKMLLINRRWNRPFPECPVETLYVMKHMQLPKREYLTVGYNLWRSHVVGGRTIESFSTSGSKVAIHEGLVFPLMARPYEVTPAYPGFQNEGFTAHAFRHGGDNRVQYGSCILGGTADLDQRPFDSFGFGLRLLTRDEAAGEETLTVFPSVSIEMRQLSPASGEKPSRAHVRLSVSRNTDMLKQKPANYEGWYGEEQVLMMTIREGDVIEVPNHPLRFYVKEIVEPDLDHDPPIYGWVEFLDFLDGEEPPSETEADRK